MAHDSVILATSELFARVSVTPAVQDLLRRLEYGGVLSCYDTSNAAQSFLAALLHQVLPQRPIVIVTQGLKAQEIMQQDLATWLALQAGNHQSRTDVASRNPIADPLFYPAWETLPHEAGLPHADVISDRLQALVALSGRQSSGVAPLVVTSVVALLQRTFPRDILAGRTRALARGDRIDPLDLTEWLEEQNYEPEAQVTQKGELALRGGILDIYPPTSPWPVRLEFFGDELESLRYFDPTTQISREEITTTTLPPAGELGILRRMQTGGQGTTPPAGKPVQPGTLLEYLPAETIFLLCEPEVLSEFAEEYAGQVPAGDPFFISWNELQQEIETRGMTALGITDSDESSAPATMDQPPLVLRWHGLEAYRPLLERAPEPQVAETQRREFFSQLHRWLRQDYAVHLFCNNDGERQRFEEIWNEYGLEGPHHPGGMTDRSRGSRLGETPGQASTEECIPKGCQNAEAEAGVGFSGTTSGVQDHGCPAPGGARSGDPRLSSASPPGWSGASSPGESAKLAGMDAGAPSSRPSPAESTDGLPVHLGALSRGFLCEAARLVVVTDAEIFGRYKVQRPRRLKSPHALATRSALDIDFSELEEGDYVVHLQHGIGRYIGLQVLPIGAGAKPTEGLAAAAHAGQECLVIEYAPSDPSQPAPRLYVPVTEAHLVSKYVGTGKARPPLNTLGGTRWLKAKIQAERAVRDVAGELLAIQAARDSQPGHAFAPDVPWQREFESAFIFEETPDQMRAILDTKADMERPKPMDRLICGDVGFGKTEVAIRAAFKAVMDGHQVALLVPTTVLAQQHFNTFRERMADYPVRIELLSRFRTRRAQQKVVEDLAAGSVDIVIGTHRLLQSDIAFKDLGLVVIDEEQRFGVLHKEKFKMLRKLVDVLTLSATPIPRTLYLALSGARDMSTIQTPPHDRLPVETIVTQYDERLIRDAIQRELNRGGQVFFLHNRVMTIHTMAQKLQTLLPHARLVVGHGQMHSDELEEVMTKFINGEADVLLSTTIIESGLDIPNANTIIIDRADRFGLSDLYQLRGRVGRYKHQAYAYLLLPRHARLLSDVRKRMSALKQYSTLGSGFKIAMRDLEIRGAGNLLGAEQSGHITAVGFDLYCQLLKQSIASLKGEKVKPRVEVQVRLDFLPLSPGEEGEQPVARKSRLESGEPGADTNVAESSGEAAKPDAAGQKARANRVRPHASIPFSYISDSRQRIEIYRKLAQATERSALQELEKEMRDRFGPPPPPLELLLQVGELKILGAEKGITTIEVQDDKLMLTRNRDYVMVGSKFPRLTKTTPAARLKEIKKLLLVL